MRGKILWNTNKEETLEEKVGRKDLADITMRVLQKEVNYVGDEEGGKMVAATQQQSGISIWIVISVVSLLLVILVLGIVGGLFWGVPGRVQEQEQVRHLVLTVYLCSNIC